jgi:hypothetical protein
VAYDKRRDAIMPKLSSGWKCFRPENERSIFLTNAEEDVSGDQDERDIFILSLASLWVLCDPTDKHHALI